MRTSLHLVSKHRITHLPWRGGFDFSATPLPDTGPKLAGFHERFSRIVTKKRKLKRPFLSSQNPLFVLFTCQENDSRSRM